jgi:signal transduction histidine kinase
MSTGPWLKIGVEVTESATILKIADNGIGIDMDYIEDIFKMFYKATEYPKGPGLGLYIVKSMTDKLEGNIEVESNIGMGTTFHLTIPNRLIKR